MSLRDSNVHPSRGRRALVVAATVALIAASWLSASPAAGEDPPPAQPAAGAPMVSGKPGDTRVDTFGMDRQRCRELRAAGKLEEAFTCVKELWEQQRDAMSSGGRIETLEQMAELYSVAQNWDSARQCYEEILRTDLSWRPRSLDSYPTAWRQPIFDAYRAFGYLGGSPGLYNIALLDFHVVDLSKKDFNLEELQSALPTLVTSLLEQNLNAHTIKDDPGLPAKTAAVDGAAPDAAAVPAVAGGAAGPRPIQIVPYAQRSALLREIAVQSHLQTEGVVTAKMLDEGTLVRAGRFAAVQGLLEGTIVRDGKDRIEVALRMTAVETGEGICGMTAKGKAKDVLKVVEKAVVQWAECATGGKLREWNARHLGELGEGAKAVLALEHYHKGLALADKDDFDGARRELQMALGMRPDFEPATVALNTITDQQDRLSLTRAMDLPQPVGLQP